MGHRNPQGIAFRPGPQVYIAEHGPEPTRRRRDQPPRGRRQLRLAVLHRRRPRLTDLIGGCLRAPGAIQASGLDVRLLRRSPPPASTFTSGSQWQRLQRAPLGQHAQGERRPPVRARRAGHGPWPRNAGHALRRPVGPPARLGFGAGRTAVPDDLERQQQRSGHPHQPRNADGGTPSGAPIASPWRPPLSQAAYPGGATNVMVATGLNFPDALAGSAVAGNFAMPVLLVRDGLDPACHAGRVDRLNPQKIYVLGGAARRVGGGSDTAPGGTRQPVRWSASFGADRFATAAAISAEFVYPQRSGGLHRRRDCVPGRAGRCAGGGAQRLAVAARADRRGHLMSTSAELTRLQPQRIYILERPRRRERRGLAAQLDGFTSGPVHRLWGPDRYATAAAVARTFWGRHPGVRGDREELPRRAGRRCRGRPVTELPSCLPGDRPSRSQPGRRSCGS